MDKKWRETSSDGLVGSSDFIWQSCETTILPGVAVSQNSPLLILPLEILELILKMITVNDIDNLIRTCRMLEGTFKSRYILHVIVPYPHSVLKHKKPVLKLTSTYNLKQLNKPIAYFSILNLNNLKELKMTGAFYMMTLSVYWNLITSKP